MQIPEIACAWQLFHRDATFLSVYMQRVAKGCCPALLELSVIYPRISTFAFSEYLLNAFVLNRMKT